MQKIKVPPLSSEQTQSMLYDIMGDAQRKVFEETNCPDPPRYAPPLGT